MIGRQAKNIFGKTSRGLMTFRSLLFTRVRAHYSMKEFYEQVPEASNLKKNILAQGLFVKEGQEEKTYVDIYKIFLIYSQIRFKELDANEQEERMSFIRNGDFYSYQKFYLSKMESREEMTHSFMAELFIDMGLDPINFQDKFINYLMRPENTQEVQTAKNGVNVLASFAKKSIYPADLPEERAFEIFNAIPGIIDQFHPNSYLDRRLVKTMKQRFIKDSIALKFKFDMEDVTFRDFDKVGSLEFQEAFKKMEQQFSTQYR